MQVILAIKRVLLEAVKCDAFNHVERCGDKCY